MQGAHSQKYWGGVVDLLKNQQDIITELQTGPLVLNISSDAVGDYHSAEDLADALQVSEKDLADLFEGKIPFVSLPGDGFLNTSVRKDVAGESADNYTEVYFWYVDGNTGNFVPGRYILTKQTNPPTGICIVSEM